MCYLQASFLCLEGTGRSECEASCPDLTPTAQSINSFETQLVQPVENAETHNLCNLCVSRGLASWEQRAKENGKSETADVSEQNMINCQVSDMGKKH